MERAAAILTVVVVFPTPPFWFATVKIRVEAGFAIASFRRRTPTTFVEAGAAGAAGVDVSRESSLFWLIGLSKHPF
jgi:hypothetical protein